MNNFFNWFLVVLWASNAVLYFTGFFEPVGWLTGLFCIALTMHAIKEAI